MVTNRMLKMLVPLTAAVVLLTSGGAHAQLGALSSGMSSLNRAMPSTSPPAMSGPSVMPPAYTPSIEAPGITNYGRGGMQRVPGSPPRLR
jgi:hypothetical protein